MSTGPSQRDWDLESVERSVEGMIVAARRVPGSTRIPSYPSHSVASLVGHVADVLERVDRGIATGRFDRSTPKPLLDDLDEAIVLLSATSRTALSALRQATDDMPLAHHFPGAPQTVAMYPRYLSIEVGIHRWDMESAAPPHAPVDRVLAVAAIDNLLDTWLPLGRADTSAVQGARHVAVTADDTSDSWVISVEQAGVSGHRTAAPVRCDAEVRGSVEALMLLLWKRVRADDAAAIRCAGDATALHDLLALNYVPDPQRA